MPFGVFKVFGTEPYPAIIFPGGGWIGTRIDGGHATFTTRELVGYDMQGQAVRLDSVEFLDPIPSSHLSGLAGIHLANALILNITFATQVLIYLAFVSLVGLVTPWASRLRLPVTAAIALVIGWHVWVRVDGRGSGYFLWDGTRSTFTYDLYVCVAICVIVAAVIALDLKRELVRSGSSPAEVDHSAQPAAAPQPQMPER